MKKNWHLYLLWTGGLCLLYGCSGPPAPKEKQAQTAGQYFNVAGFVQEQISQLKNQNPVVTKKVTEAGSNAETKKIDKVDWADELEVFQELDLNKPAFRNAYTTVRQNDPATGLTQTTYRKKPGTDGTIVYLSVYTNAQGQVSIIRGLQENKNFLLTSRRELELQYQTQNGKQRLTAYQIQGLQQPIVFKPLRYVITTQLAYR